MRLDQHHRLVEALHTGVLPTPLCRSKRGKSRRAVKTGSDTITFFALYGTMIHGCQGAVGVRWYREEGLSEQASGMTGGCLAAQREHTGDTYTWKNYG